MSPKWQRAENLSEKKHPPKPMNQVCERHICRKLFCRLTLELSRPVAGRRTRASVAHSTWPTPRRGVGLNELLGGGGCRCESQPGALAERRSGTARARTHELSAGPVRNDSMSSGTLTDTKHRFRSRITRRMQCVSAPDGFDRRSNVPTTWPKSSSHRSQGIRFASNTITECFSAA